MAAACLGERERPGPPRITFSIDDPSVTTSRTDTVAGDIRAEDPDGIDSVWVVLDTVELGDDGGFDQVFSSRYRFFVAPGRGIGEQVPLRLRARDISGFQVQRDTYVVVVP
jgi:hypothetical protein